MGLAGGINPYAYVGNDPVNGRDPSGLGGIICVPETVNNSVAFCGDDWPFSIDRDVGHSSGFLSPSRGYTGLSFGPGMGGPGGGSAPAPQKPKPPSQIRPTVGQCLRAYYDIPDISLRALLAGSVPLRKSWIGEARAFGSSAWTNAASAARKLWQADAPMRQPLPFRWVGSNTVFGIIGRLSDVALAGVAAYDLTTIGMCAAPFVP